MTRRQVLAALAAVSALLASSPLRAQEATELSGVVTTAADGLPVPGAMVSIDALGVTVVTDKDGSYAITVPADIAQGQEVEVKAASVGLRTRIVQVTLTPGSLREDFALGLGFH